MYVVLPLSTKDEIVYSVALPAIVKVSFTLGAELNPSVIKTFPDVD